MRTLIWVGLVVFCDRLCKSIEMVFDILRARLAKVWGGDSPSVFLEFEKNPYLIANPMIREESPLYVEVITSTKNRDPSGFNLEKF